MIEEEEEKWKIISENKKYEVSNLAQIRNEKTKRILKKQVTEEGYEIIGLFYKKKQKQHRVHRLVALAFIPNPNDFPEVNHKDKNRANNRVENLEWATPSMNMKHSYETGRNSNKRPVWRRDLEGKKVVFDSVTEAAELTGCYITNIVKCARGKLKTTGGSKWGYVKEKIKEIWKDIASMEIKDYPKYLIHNDGQVYSKNINHYLKPSITNGYHRICLSNDNGRRKHQVHILVAQHFCDNPDNKPIVNHKDGDKLNNDYTNLEWVTQSENLRHADSLGLIKRVSKRVHQYAREDKDKLVILHTFNSRKEVAEFLKYKNIKSVMTNISIACRSKTKTAYGYRWEYEKIKL